MADRPCVEIEYCRRCRWLLRSTWMAQELLATFEEELGGVTLVPNAEGGVFEVRVGGKRSSRGRLLGDSQRSQNSSGSCAIELRPAATSDTGMVS